MSGNTSRVAKLHLPGLFEFYDFYKLFLPIYRDYREYFYDWIEIASIYGAPSGCIWGGGRVGTGNVASKAGDVLALIEEYHISGRLTFSNSLLQQEHLADESCNRLCALFERVAEPGNGVIVHSELLAEYLKRTYPGLYLVSSTTKVLDSFEKLEQELAREEFRYVVPDFRLNTHVEWFRDLPPAHKEKIELLCNECCYIGCKDRAKCYESVSKKVLGIDGPEHICKAPDATSGYVFSKAMQNSSFVGIDKMQDIYLPMGITNYKIEGRNLGTALVLEMLLYYMVKPRYQLRIREMMYLDSMLDLF